MIINHIAYSRNVVARAPTFLVNSTFGPLVFNEEKCPTKVVPPHFSKGELHLCIDLNYQNSVFWLSVPNYRTEFCKFFDIGHPTKYKSKQKESLNKLAIKTQR